MISFQTSISPRKTILEFENSSKKRKWEETEAEEDSKKRAKDNNNTKPVFTSELHPHRPLPLEWQRCLDIQSGQIHFYNTRTKKKTCRDPRQSPEPRPSPGHMSLELELNLPCESFRSYADDNWTKHDSGSPSHNSNDLSLNSTQQMKNLGGLARSPSLLSFEADHQEMVAAVCLRCHMLVMLCKSSPSCPNCKFMHPPDQTPSNLFNRRLRLSCCKD